MEKKSTQGLVSIQDFIQERGMKLDSVRSRFSRYADCAPKVVGVEGNRNLYVKSELESFLSETSNLEGPRSSEEVIRSKIFRLEVLIEKTESRVEKRKRELQVAENDLSRYKAKLEAARVDLSYLRK